MNNDHQVLRFENVTKEDAGWYTCMAGNSLGNYFSRLKRISISHRLPRLIALSRLPQLIALSRLTQLIALSRLPRLIALSMHAALRT